jgi:hypothetical protein
MYGRLCCLFGGRFFVIVKDEAPGSGIFLNGKRPVSAVMLGLGRQWWPGSGETEVGAVLSTAHDYAF